MLKENIIYLREFLTEFRDTGSCAPSSKWAARALTNPMRAISHPKRILEAGAGSGPVTVKILREMTDHDHFTICEINPRFMRALKTKLEKNEHFLRHQNRITFFEGPVQAMGDTEKFDLIVCEIPFLNLDLGTVSEIFEKFSQISNADTVMTYFEYIGIRSMSRVVSPAERKARIRQLDSFFDDVFKRHRMQRERVWLNFLPINVYKLHMAA